MIAGLAQVMCCAFLMTVERSGLLQQSQDAVSFLAAHGITTFEPLCNTIGTYAFVLLIIGVLGRNGKHKSVQEYEGSPGEQPA